MHSAALFLNGGYDRRHPRFYARSCGPGVFIVCADGALSTFSWLRRVVEGVRAPDLVVGDFDSLDPQDRDEWLSEGARFETKPDQDSTDGQVGLARAAESGAREIVVHGAMPKSGEHNHDHFLGNLCLLTEATDRGWSAWVSEPCEAIYACTSQLDLSRRGSGLNRVSLLSLQGTARIARSEGLRWELRDFALEPSRPRALRNELLPTASHGSVVLAPGSPPVLVVHNWYECDADDD
jgi:thiamine pyrophosphokinase